MRLRFTDGQVVIEAGQGDDAQASEAIEASLQGEEIEIAFNPHFLLDGLGGHRHAVRPAVVHPAEQAGRAARPERAGRQRPTTATATS